MIYFPLILPDEKLLRVHEKGERKGVTRRCQIYCRLWSLETRGRSARSICTPARILRLARLGQQTGAMLALIRSECFLRVFIFVHLRSRLLEDDVRFDCRSDARGRAINARFLFRFRSCNVVYLRGEASSGTTVRGFLRRRGTHGDSGKIAAGNYVQAAT